MKHQLLNLASGVQEENLVTLASSYRNNSTDKAAHVKAVTLCLVFFLYYIINIHIQKCSSSNINTKGLSVEFFL